MTMNNDNQTRPTLIETIRDATAFLKVVMAVVFGFVALAGLTVWTLAYLFTSAPVASAFGVVFVVATILGGALVHSLIMTRMHKHYGEMIRDVVQAHVSVPAQIIAAPPQAPRLPSGDMSFVQTGPGSFVRESDAYSDAVAIYNKLGPLKMDPTRANVETYVGITSHSRITAAWKVLEEYGRVSLDGQGAATRWIESPP